MHLGVLTPSMVPGCDQFTDRGAHRVAAECQDWTRGSKQRWRWEDGLKGAELLQRKEKTRSENRVPHLAGLAGQREGWGRGGPVLGPTRVGGDGEQGWPWELMSPPTLTAAIK